MYMFKILPVPIRIKPLADSLEKAKKPVPIAKPAFLFV